jgi:hypothetical protein
MFAKHGNLSPTARLTAVATLLAWLSALGLCSAECFIDISQCSPAQHHAAVASHQHADSDHHHHDAASSDDADSDHDSPCDPQECNNSFCDSLKAVANTGWQASLIHHTLALAYSLAPIFRDKVLIAPQSSVHFREATERKWVFTPEVCLGPAFRSLAPPLSRLV